MAGTKQHGVNTVINALQYEERSSGIGVLIRELFGAYVRRAEEPCTVVLSKDSPTFPQGEKTVSVRAPFRHGNALGRVLYQSFGLPASCSGQSVLLVTDSKIPLFFPPGCRLVPVITDLAVFRMGEVYQRSRMLLWRAQYRLLCREAEHYAAISEFTRQEMISLLSIPPEKIDVIPCACREQFRPIREEAVLSALRQKYALPERYILFVGSENPRKNLIGLLRAYDRLRRENKTGCALVIAGAKGWRFQRETATDGLEYAQDVHFIGFASDEDLPALYSAAELFVFPSLYEGFGMPVLEAQACGTPVVAGNNSALPETGGDGAVYADVQDEKALAEAMAGVLNDTALAEELRFRGFANVRRFSWEKSADMLVQTVKKAREQDTL